jgi:predicted glycosyltransferase
VETGRLVLATAGGGEDGYDMFRTLLEAVRAYPERARFHTVLVGGPLLPPASRSRVLKLIPESSPTRFVDFLEDLPRYVAAADAVVSMGGYNAVCEILSCERPAVIVPRVAPRREQLIRAEALTRRGLVRMVHPQELEPRRLLDEVNALLAGGTAPADGRLRLNGLGAVAAELSAVLPGPHDRPAQAAAVRARR